MNNFKLVTVLNSRNDLIKYFTGLIFIHAFFFDDVVEQFSLAQKLHDQKKVFWGFNDFIELYDVGVADQFKNVYFAGDSLHVGHVNDFVLFQDLDGDFLSGGDVRGQFNLAKSAFAEGLFYGKI